MNLNKMEKEDLLRVIARLSERVTQLERLFQGQEIDSLRIKNLSVSKLTGGVLEAVATVGDTGDASKIEIDGPENRILISQDNGGTPLPSILIGKKPS